MFRISVGRNACMCVCFYRVVTALSGARGGTEHKGEVWTGDVLTGRTSVFFLCERGITTTK